VKLPDVNVLLYAANADSPRHRSALAWLERAFASSGGVAFAWVALLGFIRIGTTPGILTRPIVTETAFKFVRAWLSQPNARVVHPTERHETLLASLLLAAGKAGGITTDAHLAALAIEHGATLASFDRDFDRFDGLDFEWLRA
jgi:toxin-antitoxin system PIN domain toxin